MKIPELASHVIYHKAEGTGDQRKFVAHDATVMGYEGLEEDKLPLLRLAFAEPSRILQFGDANWASAFEQVFSVPSEEADNQGHHYYSMSSDGLDAILQATADEGARLPSAADLDADAREKEIKEATKPKAAIRVVKGK